MPIQTASSVPELAVLTVRQSVVTSTTWYWPGHDGMCGPKSTLLPYLMKHYGTDPTKSYIWRSTTPDTYTLVARPKG